MATKTSNITLTLAAVDRMTHVINRAVENGIKKFDALQKKAEGMAKASFSFAQDAGAMGLAAGAAMAIPIKAAVDFETAMLGVAKQVQGARDDGGNLTQVYRDMEASVKALTKEIPMTTTEIAEMVAAGARMGIASNELIAFTKNAAKMATAFDLPAGELAEKMGKIAKIYGIPIPEIGKLADAINFLDDNAIAKGGDIIEVMQRIGGTAKQVGLGNNNAAALASTMLTLGASAEVAATGANALMRELAIATMQPERFQRGLSAIGMNASEVQKSMATDAQGTIMKVLDALNKLPKEAQTVVTTQLFGTQYGDDIAKLAVGVSEYRHQLALLSNPKLQGSMDREFQARLKTAAAQMQILSEQVKVAAINFGSAMLPVLQSIGKFMLPIIESIAKFAQENPKLAKAIGMVTLVFSGLMILLSGAGMVFGGVMTFFSTMATLGPLVLTAFGMIATGVKAITAALVANPIGAIIAAIAIAAFLIYTYWEPISAFFVGLWNDVKMAFDQGFMNGIIKVLQYLNPVYWVAKAFNALYEYFFGINLFDAGANIVQTIADGIMSKVSAVTTAIGNVTKAARAYLPFSPAKEGAFKDLHKVKIVETIAGAMNPAPLRNAMAGATMAAMSLTPTMASATPVGNIGQGVTVNYSPVISIGGGATEQDKTSFAAMLKQHEREIVRLIRDASERDQRLKF